MDLRDEFKSCGQNVTIARDVYIEHPQSLEVGDDVTLMTGFKIYGKPRVCCIGSQVIFYPHCRVHGDGGRLVIGDHVEFFPGNILQLGNAENSLIEIGHHTHFAPYCALDGQGGLTIGAYCNIASHTHFKTGKKENGLASKQARPLANDGSNDNESHGAIILEKDIWVAAHCSLMGNVRIARGCVVGANAQVVCDTKPMGFYAGQPALRLRDR